MSSTRMIMEMNRSCFNKWVARLQRVSPLLLATSLFIGCATTKPAYPGVEAGAPASILRLDNTMASSIWAVQLLAPIGMHVTVDGFSPAEKGKLSSGGQLGQSGQLIPKGITEIRLVPGSHTLTHTGKLLGKGHYHFNPASMAFDTEVGKTYVIRFKQASTVFKPKYALVYEGWSTEQTSQWPNEVSIANPIFGH